MRARTVVSGLSALLLLTLAALNGCSDSPAKPVGTEGATCYAPTPRCNAELVCRDNVCVRGTNDASAPDGAGGSIGSDAGADVGETGSVADGGSGDAKPEDAAHDAATDKPETATTDASSSEASATEGGDASSDATEGS
jgi:hypothetical protein